jgi:quercetin dioxygenase-like cupin family protein
MQSRQIGTPSAGRKRSDHQRQRVDIMEIKRVGSQPSSKGPAEYFTGTVRVDPLFSAPDPARAGGASVTFEPGARTAWHTHPLGQTLIVTAGCGWTQREGGPVEEIRPGDVVWFAPRGKALARGLADDGDDAYRHCRKTRRQGGGLDGKGFRPAVPAVIGSGSMAAWTNDELSKIGRADELTIAAFRPDGTLRKPVTIWVVRHGDDLYVRSAYGRSAAWFRGTQERQEGRIEGGGVDKEITFADADPAPNDEIDAVYRTKYRRYGAQYVNHIVAPEVRSTTIRMAPRL